MENNRGALLGAIYRNMQLKDTDELLRIWTQNDRDEWADEAFFVLQEILLERDVEIPEQKIGTVGRKRRKNKKKKNKKQRQVPGATMWLLLSPGIILLFFIVLMWVVSVVTPVVSGIWPVVVVFGLIALQLLAVGFYSGWKSWLRVNETKRELVRKLPEMRKKKPIIYRLVTLFLPDKNVPVFYLWGMRFGSVLFIIYGIFTIQFLLELL